MVPRPISCPRFANAPRIRVYPQPRKSFEQQANEGNTYRQMRHSYVPSLLCTDSRSRAVRRKMVASLTSTSCTGSLPENE